MIATLLASADEPRPQPSHEPAPWTPDPRPMRDRPHRPTPSTTGPAVPQPRRPRYAQHRRATNPIPAPRKPEMTGPNVFTISVCSGCGYPSGDGCDCPTFTGPAVAHLLAPWAGAW